MDRRSTCLALTTGLTAPRESTGKIKNNYCAASGAIASYVAIDQLDALLLHVNGARVHVAACIL